MIYTLYNSATGQIEHVVSMDDLASPEIHFPNTAYIEGNYNGDLYYVDQGQAHLKPVKPWNGVLDYKFNFDTKDWQIDSEQSALNIRQERNRLLGEIDRVNPVWYASLSQEQQQALAAYRQQLLDVPQQSGFPSTVEWPAKPVWL